MSAPLHLHDFASAHESYQSRQEELRDYLEAFPDCLTEVEHFICALERTPASMSEINGLFRTLHTFKGNASMCQLDLLVAIAHPLEDLVGAMRANTLSFTADLGEVILMVMDRIQQTARHLMEGRPLTPLRLQEIMEGLRGIARAGDSESDARALRLIELISGQPAIKQERPLHPAEADIVSMGASEAQQADLRFFRQLSLMTEKRSPFWEGRTCRILRMAVETNETAGKPCDPVQLEAAIYLHDFGMGFLPESIWTKQGRLNDLELRDLRTHPAVGAGLLERMPGWEEAAEVVIQHHEKLDGSGYPNSIKANQISHGAKLLAILDAFEAMTHERVDRHHKKSVIRAMTELNACDDQFEKGWVKVFNQVVRRMLESE